MKEKGGGGDVGEGKRLRERERLPALLMIHCF